jgi:mRNA interferase HigB
MCFLSITAAMQTPKPHPSSVNLPVVPESGTTHILSLWDRMQIVSRRTLKQFWDKNPRAAKSMAAWASVVARADWSGPHDVKTEFGGSVDFLEDNRAVFDIGGNRFRIVARINYRYKAIMIKFVGTHAEYNKVDAATVGRPKVDGR